MNEGAPMNSKNQIDRAVKTMVDGIKDAVDINIVTAARSKQIDIKPEQLPTLLALIKASIEEGHLKGSRTFTRTIADALAAAETPPLVTKKKSG